MTHDMTNGKPGRLILLFSLPIILGNVFQQFYTLIDTLIVGQTLGVDALAAVGCTGSVTLLVLSFIQGFTTGFSVLLGQRFGAGDREGVRRSAAVSIKLCIVLTVLITGVSVALAGPVLQLMDTPGDIYADATAYMQAIFAGSAATVLYNMLANMIRALGDARTPLIFLVLSSVLNIGLDLLFICVFHMGVPGAAWATVAAQLISGLLCLWQVRRKFEILRLSRKDFQREKGATWAHLKMGLPMGLQMSVLTIGLIAVQAALNGLGKQAVAAFTAGSRVNNLIVQLVVSFGVATATFVAQNYGAKRMDRIRQGVKMSLLLAMCFCVAGGLVAWFLGGPLSALFIEGEQPEITGMARQYLQIMAPFYPLVGLLTVLRNAVQSMGNALIPMLACALELVMRSLAALLLVRVLAFAGVCYATPVAWICSVAMVTVGYFLVLRRRQRTLEDSA